MPHIEILVASVRRGRNSNRVGLFFKAFIDRNNLAETSLLDLDEYNFPLFEERLQYLENPPAGAAEYAERIRKADAVIIVTPEYNGGYPASLKNAIDFLYPEWFRKPIGIATVSDGIFGGSQVITSLLFSLWKMKAWVVPSMFPVPKVDEAYDESGIPKDPKSAEKRAAVFVNDILWCIQAKAKMQ
jgi:NAD(P)H-dependent FMN reductase